MIQVHPGERAYGVPHATWHTLGGTFVNLDDYDAEAVQSAAPGN
jgi:hypothetical protein